jgi:PAS domain S-box-containing protein
MADYTEKSPEDYARMSKEELVVELRDLLADRAAMRASRTETDENRRLAQELHIHQVELEMQNHELREAQIALATSRDRYADLYDSTPVAYFTLDKNGVLEEVNQTGVALLLTQKARLVGQPFVSVARLEGPGPFLALLHRCLADGQPAEAELRLVGRDGVVRSFHATAAPVIHPSGRALACRMALTDVTRLKRAVADLRRALDAERELKARLAAITRAHVAVSATIADEPAGVRPALQVVADYARALVNAEYTALGVDGSADMGFDPWVFSGMSEEQARAIGRAPRCVGVLAHAADASSVVRMRDLRQDPTHRGFPVHHPRMTSFLGVPIRRAGRSLGTLYAANKIGADEFTEDEVVALEMLAGRVAAALEIDRLRDEKARALAWLREVVDQMPEAIVLLGEHEAGAVSLNKAARALFGDTVTLLEPGGAPVADDALPHRRAGRGEIVVGLELRARRPDGTLVPVLVNAAPVDDGRPGSAVAVLRDVSAQKLLEQERETWTGVIVHDLRQPIAVVNMAAQVLARGAARLDAHEIRAVERMRAAIDGLIRMVDDLLDVTLIELRRLPVAPRCLELAKLVEEIVDRYRPTLGDRRVHVKTPAEAVIVTADPERLGQLLVNLLSNAAKYGAPGSDIEVRVERLEGGGQVAVTNRGEGLTPEDAARIFERFRRTDQAVKSGQRGLGLGLYIAKGIVDGHGGRIAVESTPGETTTFRFWLPGEKADG